MKYTLVFISLAFEMLESGLYHVPGDWHGGR